MKRYTDTEKWNDPWYQKLSGPAKQLWDYVCGKCDPAGIIRLDLEIASLEIRQKIEIEHVLELGEDRFQTLGNGHFFITGFIYFQYGELSPKCKAHNTVQKLIKLHNLFRASLKRYRFPPDKIGKPIAQLYQQSDLTLDLSDPAEQEQEELPPEAEYWNLVIPEKFSRVTNFSTTRWRYLKLRRKDPYWVANLEVAIDKIITSEFCNGKNDRGWIPSFDFLLERVDIVQKIMEGKYDNRNNTTNHRNSTIASSTPTADRSQRAESIAQRKLAGQVASPPGLPRQAEGTGTGV